MTAPSRVIRRFTPSFPCPVCGGHDGLPRGQGERCAGFLSDDELIAYCTVASKAGGLTREEKTSPPSFRHRLDGRCGCGSSHGSGRASAPTSRGATSLGTIVATYPYRDRTGTVVLEVVRFNPKGFRQRRPKNGSWTWNTSGVPTIPYRLQELTGAGADDTVFVVEGEKDADRLAQEGLIATCNAGGAGKWRDEHSRALGRRPVVILPDNDDAGRAHAEGVAASLARIGSRVRIVALPGLVERGDVSDWLAAGNTVDDLRALVDAAPERSIAATGATADETDPEDRRERGPKTSSAERLVELVDCADVELFHAGDRAYATVPVNGHRETHSIERRSFDQWLRHHHWSATGKSVSSTVLADTRETLKSRALYAGDERPIYRRVGELAVESGNGIVIDLGTDDWCGVLVTDQGWEVRENLASRLFTRSRGMAPLPRPERGGSSADLREFVNVGDGSDGEGRFALLLGWLMAALRPRGPYPLLVVSGEQGSAKSSAFRVLRGLVDPSTSLLRSLPGSERDLMISANNSWCLTFDNVSHISAWQSDCLCRLATGGGLSQRELHTDDEEIIFDAQRPVMVNGIEDLVNRSDLLSRAVPVRLPRLANPRPEAEFEAALARAKPRLFGALLDGLVGGLQDLPTVDAPMNLSRMPDFLVWGIATERGLGRPAGAFAAAYAEAYGEAHHLALEASPVATALRAWWEGKTDWSGSGQELLEELFPGLDETTRRRQRLPSNSKSLKGELRRLAPNLRAVVGIDVSVDEPRRNKVRPITIIGCVTTVTSVTSNTNPGDARAPGVTQALLSVTHAVESALPGR